MRADATGTADHSPETVSIRSRVNEYGGGALSLVPGRAAGAFAYVDQSDQRVWFCDGAGAAPGAVAPVALCAPPPTGEIHNHGGLSATANGQWVLAVREIHREGSARPLRCVVALSTVAGSPCETVLLDGHDFFGSPRVDQAADRLAVVAWDHPDMPWDASTVLLLPLGRRSCTAHDHEVLQAARPARPVAGGRAESVGQPDWCHDGSLRFVSDREGWWQPYVHPGRVGADEEPTPLTRAGRRVPRSGLGARSAHHGGNDRRDTGGPDDVTGGDALVALHVPGDAGAPRPRPAPQECVSIAALCAHGNGVALIGSTPDMPSTVWVWSPEDPRGPSVPTLAWSSNTGTSRWGSRSR